MTFYAGAIEGPLGASLPDNESLLTFVRSKKVDWSIDDRYVNTSSSFDVEAGEGPCVRYALSADDRWAKNRGSYEALPMRVSGRFCLHPQDRSVAVDIYYSIRSVPSFDTSGMVMEGEAFLRTLQFSSIKKP